MNRYGTHWTLTADAVEITCSLPKACMCRKSDALSLISSKIQPHKLTWNWKIKSWTSSGCTSNSLVLKNPTIWLSHLSKKTQKKTVLFLSSTFLNKKCNLATGGYTVFLLSYSLLSTSPVQWCCSYAQRLLPVCDPLLLALTSLTCIENFSFRMLYKDISETNH